MSENKKKFTYFYLTTYGRSLPKEQQGLDVEFTTYARSLSDKTIKDIQKRFIIWYNTIILSLVSCKARNLYNILSYKEKTNDFFKNKECIGNNK